MNPRWMAMQEILNSQGQGKKQGNLTEKAQFGILSFHLGEMKKRLSGDVYDNVVQAMVGKGKINSAYADQIASAMQQWASGHGATHFCHWFQPQTGAPAEKHDSFIDWSDEGKIIERFSGKSLLKGEPDASSFPSGGLRRTSNARGYTCWDPSSFPFIWKTEKGALLCIPSIYYSWKGEALDMKIPLLRSEAKINQAALRLTALLGIPADYVYSTLGCEQEYFLVDRRLYLQRPDLQLVGKTVFGAAPAKSQELEDHYFGSIKERVMLFMKDFEERAQLLGIPVKTRHNEVAPNQFEVAPLFERASIAVDHNLLLMELMRQVALHHELVCLFHEKPFAKLNGSGKHCNWSLSTNMGVNLLDPTATGQNRWLFLLVLTAVLCAVHKYSGLLRAAIASQSNDYRLGGHEAPPAIISVYLGQALEKFLDHFVKDPSARYESFFTQNMDITSLPELIFDKADRNRTSPFAFTGNKFEFRSVGASSNCSLPATVINVIVASSLNDLVDEIERQLVKGVSLDKACFKIVRDGLKESQNIRFSGDNYSEGWKVEAKKRKLPILEKAVEAYPYFLTKEGISSFEGVLAKEEIKARVSTMFDHYGSMMNIEAKLMHELFYEQIYPVVVEQQKGYAKAIKVLKQVGIKAYKEQLSHLDSLSLLVEKALKAAKILEKEREKALELEGEERASYFAEKVSKRMLDLRHAVDGLEKMVDDRLWTLPKYRELLFLL